MKSLNQVANLHMEFSSKCNARCPLCPRNLNGYPYNSGYEETSLTLDLIKSRFTPSFIQQLYNGILINGNFGDFTSNLESIPIIQYFIDCNPNIKIRISTNGSARNLEFWSTLGSMSKNIQIEFALDGLEDTHHLYRQDTNWLKIIENAENFMFAGGYAIWKMIIFDHNRHQIEECKELSQQLGFNEFLPLELGRDTGIVFNRDGTYSHSIGKVEHINSIEDMISSAESNNYKRIDSKIESISCLSLDEKTIYIAADGKVYPCCFMGFNPATYRRTGFTDPNKQIAKIMLKNDLNEYDLETCLEWFNDIKKAWTKESKSERLMTCDNSCGRCNK